MTSSELILLAIGLSMDAFAVAVTNGMCKKNIGLSKAIYIALTFGLFQGAMPCIGYALGSSLSAYINKFDHWIALILLSFIGGKMIYDSFESKDECFDENCNLSFGQLMIQGVATSIDALAVGVSFAAMNVSIVISAPVICLVTFIISLVGVYIGLKSGAILNKKAQLVGGLILVGIGVKIFIQHMFF